MINTLSFLKGLIERRSEPHVSNAEVIEFISRHFEGYTQEIIHQEKGGLALQNLIVRIPGTNPQKQPLVFSMHTDTVEGKWFTALKETPARIVGLGSCDMKGGLACACAAATKKSYERDIYLLFSADEETTSIGTRLMVEHLDLHEAIVILTEPTTHRAFTSQRGCLNLMISTTGNRMHASAIPKGAIVKESAIEKMIDLCLYLREEAAANDAVVTQNFGSIKGGTDSNIIPESCTLSLDRRYHPEADFHNEARTLKESLEAKGATVDVAFIGDSFKNTDENLLERFKDLLKDDLDVECGLFPAWSEGGILKSVGSCIIFGPGELKDAHTTGESILKDDLVLFTTLYERLIEGL